jgi:hypothetical protein
MKHVRRKGVSVKMSQDAAQRVEAFMREGVSAPGAAEGWPAEEAAEWRTVLAGLDARQSRALTALQQEHGDRLAQLEERLGSVERAAADLGGQVRAMR